MQENSLTFNNIYSNYYTICYKFSLHRHHLALISGYTYFSLYYYKPQIHILFNEF